MTDAAFRDHSWGDATPIGTHYRCNRQQLQGERGALGFPRNRGGFLIGVAVLHAGVV